jgi:hypothetical protein
MTDQIKQAEKKPRATRSDKGVPRGPRKGPKTNVRPSGPHKQADRNPDPTLFDWANGTIGGPTGQGWVKYGWGEDAE